MAKQNGELYEELLVLRAKAHDTSALTQLVERWHGRLLAHARRLTRNPDGAEEAMQEAWMAIVRGIGKLNDPAAFSFWAYRIVGRECANWVHGRQRSRRDGSNDGLAQAPTQTDVPSEPHLLARAMDSLSVEHREVLALHYMQEMSVEQIAETLKIKQGTIKSRLHYAREAIRRAMACESHE
jgi:RNA polymerase sigma factor (sigma-70 family)